MSDGRAPRVAVVGATGLVGGEITSLLDEREFPVSELLLYAAEDCDGDEVDFRAATLRVGQLPEELPGLDLVFLCATTEVSRDVGRGAAERGAVVIDLAAAPAVESDVPLVLGAGDLPAAARGPGGGMLVRLADPLARLAAVPLRALASLGELRRVVSTFLVSASMFGRKQVDRLSEETVNLLNLRESAESEAAPDLAFRCTPHTSTGAGSMADRVAAEIAHLLGGSAALAVSIVEVPMFVGQAASLSMEFASSVALDQIRAALRETPSVVVTESGGEALSSLDAVDTDGIVVLALRQDVADPRWVHFWLLGDNVRQGAALPAVALAEAILESRGSLRNGEQEPG